MAAGLFGVWWVLAMTLSQTGGVALAGINPVVGMTSAVYSGPGMIALAAAAFAVRKSAAPVAVAVPAVAPKPRPAPRKR